MYGIRIMSVVWFVVVLVMVSVSAGDADAPAGPVVNIHLSMRLLRMDPEFAGHLRAVAALDAEAADVDDETLPGAPFFGTVKDRVRLDTFLKEMERDEAGVILTAQNLIARGGLQCQWMIGGEVPVYMPGPWKEAGAEPADLGEADAVLEYPFPKLEKAGLTVEIRATLEDPPRRRAMLEFNLRRVAPRGWFPVVARAKAGAMPMRRAVFERREMALEAPIHDGETWVLVGLEDYAMAREALVTADERDWTVPVVLVTAAWLPANPPLEDGRNEPMSAAWLERLMPGDPAGAPIVVPANAAPPMEALPDVPRERFF